MVRHTHGARIVEQKEQHVLLQLFIQLEVQLDLVLSARFQSRLVASVATVLMTQRHTDLKTPDSS